MLATLPASAPRLTDPALVYEPKYDGIRAIVEVRPEAPRATGIWSRLGNDKTAEFPTIAGALGEWGATLPGVVVADGEIVAIDARGRPAGFEHLRKRHGGVALVIFDLLRLGDDDLRGQPLAERRRALDALWRAHPPASRELRIARQEVGDGRALVARARREGWEGLVVKHARSPYRAGRRSPEWIKLKLLRQDEFVVGGWTPPKGTRARFGALLLGTREGRALRYAGDVGTGFTDAELERVWERLRRIETPACPFDPPPPAARSAHWVKPLLVAAVRYAELTHEGRLRHPVYLGLRDDVRPGSVAAPETRRARSDGPSGDRTPAPSPLLDRLTDLEARRGNGQVVLPDGDWLDVTNLHKVFWPAVGRTKGDLLRHYVRVAPFILPVVADRPLVMKRLPNGVEGKAFYQHRAPDEVPAGVRTEPLPDDDVPARLVGGSLKTLLYMAQLAAISMDPFFSRVGALHTPDHVAIDLDPQPGAAFGRVLDVARWVRDELSRLDVPSFPKTSGAEGLHIYIPLPPGTPYQAGLLLCQIVATLVAARHPKAATIERAVGRRRRDAVYVDYLQNIEGKTLACAYSARASAFAGVSTPLTWAEVERSPAPSPQDFTIDTIAARLASVGDLWAGLRAHPGVDLRDALDRLRT